MKVNRKKFNIVFGIVKLLWIISAYVCIFSGHINEGTALFITNFALSFIWIGGLIL